MAFIEQNIHTKKAKTMDKFLEAAIEEAQKGFDEGGIPIGSVLVIDGKIVGRGHNRRVQKGMLSCMRRWTVWKMRGV